MNQKRLCDPPNLSARDRQKTDGIDGVVRFAIETTTSRGPLTGIGQYVQRLSEAILPLLAQDECLLGFDGLSCKPIDLATIRAVESHNEIVSDAGHRTGLRRAGHNIYLSLRSAGPARTALRHLKQRLFQRNESLFDVFHAVQMIPPGPFRKPVLPLIHDLSHIRFPRSHPAERVRWIEQRLKLVVGKVPFIQTVSEFSKREIIELLGVPTERIHVSYPGIAPSMSLYPRSNETSDALARFGVTPGQYFLLVSTREPRKNFKSATEAYASLPAILKRRYPLLWVGHRGWGDLQLSSAAERAIREGQIRITGYVADGDMPYLYRSTSLFMMPSLYEGFGMPITEALTCGAPVAVSDIPVFREVAGAYARYVEPLDVDGWRNAMSDAAGERCRSVDTKDLAEWLARYSWKLNAAQTLELYRQLAGRGS